MDKFLPFIFLILLPFIDNCKGGCCKEEKEKEIEISVNIIKEKKIIKEEEAPSPPALLPPSGISPSEFIEFLKLTPSNIDLVGFLPSKSLKKIFEKMKNSIIKEVLDNFLSLLPFKWDKNRDCLFFYSEKDSAGILCEGINFDESKAKNIHQIQGVKIYDFIIKDKNISLTKINSKILISKKSMAEKFIETKNGIFPSLKKEQLEVVKEFMVMDPYKEFKLFLLNPSISPLGFQPRTLKSVVIFISSTGGILALFLSETAKEKVVSEKLKEHLLKIDNDWSNYINKLLGKKLLISLETIKEADFVVRRLEILKREPFLEVRSKGGDVSSLIATIVSEFLY